jgi:hypothetical protein
LTLMRLNLQLNGNTANSTRIYTEIWRQTLSNWVFPVSLCSAVSTSVAIKVQDRVDDKTEVSFDTPVELSIYKQNALDIKCW